MEENKGYVENNRDELELKKRLGFKDKRTTRIIILTIIIVLISLIVKVIINV